LTSSHSVFTGPKTNAPDVHKGQKSAPEQRPYIVKMRMVIDHFPYYVKRLRGVPYGALRRLIRRKCCAYSMIEPFLTNKCGLEIGGPSPFFRRNRLLPVYDRCRQIDNCDFSGQTIWNDAAEKRGFETIFGKRYVAEACDLLAIPDASYDFLVASHVLEHIANPLRALQEWKRVLKPGAALLILVPDRRNTFDHRRPFTSFEHIESDFLAHTREDDLTHLDEILSLHDLKLDPGAGSREQFVGRCLRNDEIRAMHHHVFSSEVLAAMFVRLNMRVLNFSFERPDHIVFFARKTGPTEQE
jgi:SAM-dependent methyltransferase